MSIYPCEARKYLGVGDTEAGDPRPTCKHPIQWRVSFYAPTPEGGEQRAAIAYFCTTHRDQVVALMANHADTLSDHLTGVDVRAYTPKVADRVANTPEAVRSDLVATRAALRAGEL